MNHLVKTLLAIALLLCAAPSSRAQDFLPYPGGVTLITRDFDPAHPGEGILKPVFGNPNLLGQAVDAAWQSARAPIADQIIAQMGRANSVAGGVTPYNIACTMGKPGDLSVKPGSYARGSTLEMKYLVRGNWIEFDTTQPTALGKWADPRFSCTYDLTLTLSMSLGDAPGPLRMTGVKAQLSNSKLDSHGLIADLVFIGNAVTKLFGTDFIKKAQSAIDGKNFDFTGKLNGALAPFNAMLSDIERQGYALADSLLNAPAGPLPGGLRPSSLPGATPQGPQLVMFLQSDGKIPTRGTGEISGAIRWKKALGEPEPQAIAAGARRLGRASLNARHPFGRGFRIRAVAQSGFGRAESFTPPMTEVGVLKGIKLDEAASAGDEYVLRYSIGELPLGIPIKVEAALSDVAWQGQIGANQQRGVGPQGWSGVITLKPGRKLVISALTSIAGSVIATEGDAASLNPQPLPPEPDPDVTAPRLSARRGVGSLRRARPGGTVIGPATSVKRDLGALAARMPRVTVENPTGTIAVGGIDFEVGLINGPR